MNTKIITILITGIVFTAGLAVGFGGYVFAGDPVGGLDITIEQIPGGKVSTQKYSSSLSNKSVGKVRQEVGDILLGYGIGGADINKVTDALEGSGVYEAELKAFLVAIGINEEGVQGIFIKLDGIDIKSTEAVSTPSAGDTPQSKQYIKIQGLPGKAVLDAKELRENFRENVKTVFVGLDQDDLIGGSSTRIALAHGKGLRMINRFRSAMARFDHILGRMESRIEKLEAQGVDTSSVAPFIEKAKNISIENEAKMEELKAKYESLLLGENVGGIAKEARAIAQKLKVGIENIRTNISTPSGSVILVKMEKKKY